MLPMILAKKILDLTEQELVKVLRQLEMDDREAYNTIQEKIAEL